MMNDFKELWSDLTPKGRVCAVLLLPLSTVGIALMARRALAEKGCAAVVGFWGHVEVGVQALLLGLFMAFVITYLIRIILGIPEIAGEVKNKLENRRVKKAWKIKHYGHTHFEIKWKPVLAVLAIGAAIVLFGSGIGYIAWLLSC